MVSKVKVGKKRIEKNRDFCFISECASVNHCSLTAYKTNGHKRPPTFINREFWENLCKTYAISEILAFSICSLFWRTYAINAYGSLGKIKIQKNPAIKDWIAENKKMVGHFRLIQNFLSSSNGCELTENAQCFNNSRKYLCFQRFLKQRKIFSSIKRTFSTKQMQNAPKNSCTSDLCLKSVHFMLYYQS